MSQIAEGSIVYHRSTHTIQTRKYILPIATDNRSISDTPNVFIGRITNSVNRGSFSSTRFSNASHDRSDPPLPLLCYFTIDTCTKQTEMNVERQYYWTVSHKARRITSFLPSHVAYLQQETISLTMIVRDRTRGVESEFIEISGCGSSMRIKRVSFLAGRMNTCVWI